VSVAQVARAHDINANQLFAWRKLYREGHLGGPGESRALIPVQVRDEAEKQGSLQQSKPTGVIEIDLGHARVRIEGLVDPACVRAAVAGLLR
jgi:transposase